MITLYHCMSARSFRPLWTLEELSLSYELKMLPFPPRVQPEELLEINPLGTVPTFFDDGMRMTESSAICQYLGTRHGDGILTVRPEEEDFGPLPQLGPFRRGDPYLPANLVLRYGRFEPDERKLPQVADDYTRWFLSRLKAINAALVDREYLCASRFTVADVSVGYALMLATISGWRPFPDRGLSTGTAVNAAGSSARWSGSGSLPLSRVCRLRPPHAYSPSSTSARRKSYG